MMASLQSLVCLCLFRWSSSPPLLYNFFFLYFSPVLIAKPIYLSWPCAHTSLLMIKANFPAPQTIVMNLHASFWSSDPLTFNVYPEICYLHQSQECHDRLFLTGFSTSHEDGSNQKKKSQSQMVYVWSSSRWGVRVVGRVRSSFWIPRGWWRHRIHQNAWYKHHGPLCVS